MSDKVSCNMNIPVDLTVEILKKLPAKSLARFQCVSKQWTSIIRDFIVIDSIVVRSVTQPPRDPHFIVSRYKDYKSNSVYSYAYPHQITNEEHLYHDEVFKKTNSGVMFQYVRGLIGYWSFFNNQFIIYNPTTTKSVPLPKACLLKCCPYLFGYDPLKNQYKIVCLTQTGNEWTESFCQVFTLGDPKKEWVDIECGIGYHFSIGNFVCINGTIYYRAKFSSSGRNSKYFLVSFDVGTHKFDRVQVPEKLMPVRNGILPLINFQGKLACMCHDIKSEDVDMWVMENAEKKEWLKFTFVDMLQGLTTNVRFLGVTAHPRGEIVMFQENFCEEEELVSEVYYYDTKLNIRRRVEIKTATSSERIRPGGHFDICLAVADHVENIMCLSSFV